MIFDAEHNLPSDFASSSRVWIYQANRTLQEEEKQEINIRLNHFVQHWTSHSQKVKGFAGIFFQQFIILIADETAATVSGCSTDSSMHLIKELQLQFQIDLLNRQQLAFLHKEKIELINLHELNEALQQQRISTDSLYFNNLVSTYQELKEKWIIPLRESWLSSRLEKLNTCL